MRCAPLKPSSQGRATEARGWTCQIHRELGSDGALIEDAEFDSSPSFAA